MKCEIIFAAALLISDFARAADDSRYVTATVPSVGSPQGVIQIQQGETAEIITCQIASQFGSDSLSGLCIVEKDGIKFTGYPSGYGMGYDSAIHGTTVTGPAMISTPTGGSNAILLTVKITPAAYDVNKTLIIPPGTNQVYVALESSTNLVLWADATNGVYGSPDMGGDWRSGRGPAGRRDWQATQKIIQRSALLRSELLTEKANLC